MERDDRLAGVEMGPENVRKRPGRTMASETVGSPRAIVQNPGCQAIRIDGARLFGGDASEGALALQSFARDAMSCQTVPDP